MKNYLKVLFMSSRKKSLAVRKKMHYGCIVGYYHEAKEGGSSNLLI